MAGHGAVLEFDGPIADHHLGRDMGRCLSDERQDRLSITRPTPGSRVCRTVWPHCGTAQARSSMPTCPAILRSRATLRAAPAAERSPDTRQSRENGQNRSQNGRSASRQPAGIPIARLHVRSSRRPVESALQAAVAAMDGSVGVRF